METQEKRVHLGDAKLNYFNLSKVGKLLFLNRGLTLQPRRSYDIGVINFKYMFLKIVKKNKEWMHESLKH